MPTTVSSAARRPRATPRLITNSTLGPGRPPAGTTPGRTRRGGGCRSWSVTPGPSGPPPSWAICAAVGPTAEPRGMRANREPGAVGHRDAAGRGASTRSPAPGSASSPTSRPSAAPKNPDVAAVDAPWAPTSSWSTPRRNRRGGPRRPGRRRARRCVALSIRVGGRPRRSSCTALADAVGRRPWRCGRRSVDPGPTADPHGRSSRSGGGRGWPSGPDTYGASVLAALGIAVVPADRGRYPEVDPAHAATADLVLVPSEPYAVHRRAPRRAPSPTARGSTARTCSGGALGPQPPSTGSAAWWWTSERTCWRTSP